MPGLPGELPTVAPAPTPEAPKPANPPIATEPSPVSSVAGASVGELSGPKAPDTSKKADTLSPGSIENKHGYDTLTKALEQKLKLKEGELDPKFVQAIVEQIAGKEEDNRVLTPEEVQKKVEAKLEEARRSTIVGIYKRFIANEVKLQAKAEGLDEAQQQTRAEVALAKLEEGLPRDFDTQQFAELLGNRAAELIGHKIASASLPSIISAVFEALAPRR